MSVSMKQVAQAVGVSTATVSHVINGTRYVAEETKAKVLRAMKELDYRPNNVARSLRSQKSSIIGLIVPLSASDTANFFFMSIAQGIEEVLKEAGYNLILSNSNERLADELEQIKVFNSQFIEGLIIAPTAEDHEEFARTLGPYPVVFVDRKPRGFSGDCVLADGYGGTYEAIEMMIKKKHTRIGFISGPLGYTTSDERLAGYKKALEDNGIPVDESLIKEGSPSFESGYTFARELVKEQRVSALFVANNIMTIGAMGFLQDAQIKIPSELAVIGFDDYEWTRITNPPLTVIKQPAYELGRKAAEILLSRINSKKKTPFQEYRLPTELVMRASC